MDLEVYKLFSYSMWFGFPHVLAQKGDKDELYICPRGLYLIIHHASSICVR